MKKTIRDILLAELRSIPKDDRREVLSFFIEHGLISQAEIENFPIQQKCDQPSSNPSLLEANLDEKTKEAMRC